MSKEVEPGCFGILFIVSGLVALIAIASAIAKISQTLTQISDKL